LKTVKTPSGFKIRGSLIGQMEKLAAWNSNNNKYGITVKQILSEGYSKLDNPYLRGWTSKEEFLKTSRQLLSYIKNTSPGVKALWHIKPEHIQSYVENYLGNYDWAKQTLQKQSAQIGKLEKMIKYTLGYKGVNFGEQKLYSGRWLANKIASNMKTSHSRSAYKNPMGLLVKINITSSLSKNSALFAQAQKEGGFRFGELQYTRKENLKGITADEVTGEEKGIIHVKGKGGFERNCFISPQTYSRIEGVVNKEGKFFVDYNRYLSDLYSTSKATAQVYQGSHGLRYNFAQDRYDECLKNDHSHEEALKEVSEEMGHHRADITEHYL